MIVLLGESIYNQINPKVPVLLKDVPKDCIISKPFKAYKDADINKVKNPPLLFKGWVLVSSYDEKSVTKVLRNVDTEKNLVILVCETLNALNAAIHSLEAYKVTVLNNFTIPKEVKRGYIRNCLGCKENVIDEVMKASGTSLYILNRNIDYLRSCTVINQSVLKNLYNVLDLQIQDVPVLLLQSLISSRDKKRLLDFFHSHNYYIIKELHSVLDEVDKMCTLIELGSLTYTNYKGYKTDLYERTVYDVLELMSNNSYDGITQVMMFLKSLKVDRLDFTKLIIFIKEKRIG